MGTVWVTSKSTARRHGVYAIEGTPPPTIRAIGTGVACIVEQFPWGPVQALTAPAGPKELRDMICPAGMDQTHQGYLATIRKGFPTLKFLRVLGSTAVTAAATINKTGPTALFVVHLKYGGTAGNSATVTVSAASDGDANHFDLAVTVTGASGTTTDTIANYNLSGTGSDTVLTVTQLAQLKLVGSITKSSAGVPILGTTSCSAGTNGTIAAADYVGTIGTGDKGLTKLEGDGSIRHVFVGNPGNTIRPDANAGLQAHVEYLGDRRCYINGNSGQSLSDVATDVANYRSKRVHYVDSWAYLKDDLGTKTLVAPGPFCASVASQVSPSTPFSWRAAEVQKMLSGIVDLEADRGQGAADNTDAGVVTLCREENGGFTFEADVLTIAPSDPSVADGTRTAMGDYIAVSIVRSIRSLIDSPNIEANQDLAVGAIDAFMSGLKKNSQASRDPNHTPHVLDYAIGDTAAANAQADIDAGEFDVPLDAKLSVGMKKLFVNTRYGSTVTVSHE